VPELFIELFSEEIPARMQRGGSAELERALAAALAPIAPAGVRAWYGPRRIAWRADVSGQVAASATIERGPRATAPEQALAGFLRKHAAAREQLRVEGDYWVLEKTSPAVPAADLIAAAMPGLLRRFAWPKSMRWGGSSAFTWVRPLRRITCLLDGDIVPFDLREGTDDGHGLASGNLTEGHRFHAPGAFAVRGAGDWQQALLSRRVIVDAADRKRAVAERIAGLAAERGLAVADDPGLLDEVAGLVEWPVPHLGRIADQHMDLPAEVMQVSMRVNQRYFALRTADGAAAPWFAFVANIEADDGGAAIIAGNERVLRARFSDARHFWDLDRKVRLTDRVAALDGVTFHAKLGSQGARVRRLVALAAAIAPHVGADPGLAERAALLAKADLTSGMVGEFPELQGVMGRYYALHDHEDPAVADAVRDHYAPRGPGEAVPSAPVSVAVALADKIDQLVGFFWVGEKPTGSGDPFALRRAALGVVRIVRENGLRIRLLAAAETALQGLRESDREAHDRKLAMRTGGGDSMQSAARVTAPIPGAPGSVADTILLEVMDFIRERLRVQLRAEGKRYDVLEAVSAAQLDDDVTRLLARTDAVAQFLSTYDGADLLAAYRRAANIVRIEDKKDGPHDGEPAPGTEPGEAALFQALAGMTGIAPLLAAENYAAAMSLTATLRAPLDTFFEKVTVNAAEPELRRNRLRLLNQVRSIMDRIADFSRIEG
jgi:glycyl-tRNA synthetase beta chain